MTKSTNKAICNNGNIARKIEFNTICRPLHKKKYNFEFFFFSITTAITKLIIISSYQNTCNQINKQAGKG
jgi:hypothetical protein